MPIELDTAQLRTFTACARAGSISAAAVALGRSQPALSQQLRRLEDIVGGSLLRRTPTGVTLTEAGESLLSYAERILSLSGEALVALASDRMLVGRCGVGLLEDLASAFLPQALADFARLHPAISLELMTAPGPAMSEALDSGRIQLALCDASYMSIAPKWSVRLPLAWAAGPDFDAFADPLPLVLFSQPCRWRAPILAALDAAGRPWRMGFESTGMAGVQAAVRAGLGVAALLPSNLGPWATQNGLHCLPPLPNVEIALVRRPGTEGQPLIDAVEGLLRRLAVG